MRKDHYKEYRLKFAMKLITMFIFWMVGRSDAIIAYDCSGSSSKVSEISLVDAENCDSKMKNITSRDVHIQLIQPTIFKEVVYYQCLIEIEHLIYRCGVSIDTLTHNGFYDELLFISAEDCQNLILNGKLRYQGYNIEIPPKSQLRFLSMETLGSIKYGSCSPGPDSNINGVFYDRPVRTSKFKIKTKIGKGTLDVEESKLITEERVRK